MKFIYTFLFTFLSIVLIGQNIPTILNEDFNNQINLDGNIIAQKDVKDIVALDPELEAALQLVVDDYATAQGVLGVSAAMNFEDGEIWAYANGKANENDLLTSDHSLAVGSISKTITAATILKLYDEELLDLEDEIGQWVTHENIDPDITIRQCLNHTSGIYNYTDNTAFASQIFLDMSRIWEPMEVIDLMVEPKVFDKGTDWGYSNTNYLILGIIIEKVANGDYHTIVREKVLSPAGLDDVQLHVYEPLNTDLANLYMNPGTGVIDLTAFAGPLNALFSPAWAAGAYVGRPSDITKWAKSLYKGDLLSSSSMVEMLTPHPISTGYGYGLGSSVIDLADGSRVYGHNGEIVYSAAMLYIPVFDLSIVSCTNDGTINGDGIGNLSNLLLIAYNDYMVSVEDINEINTIDVFPNPVLDKMNLKIDIAQKANVKLSLINSIGIETSLESTLNQAPGVHEMELDLSDQIPGVYHIKVSVNDQFVTKRIIVL